MSSQVESFYDAVARTVAYAVFDAAARRVTMRKARDARLELPALIVPSVQVNIRAGAMPTPEANGVSYLRLPINAL